MVYDICLVTLLHLLADNHRIASIFYWFFLTICKGLAYGLLDGRQMPCSIFKVNPFFTINKRSSGRRYGREKSSGPWVKMWCVTICLVLKLNPLVRTKRRHFFKSRWYLELSLKALIPLDMFVTFPTIDNFVFSLTKRAFFLSTIKPKKCEKSTPFMGLFTVAMTNDYLNARCKPRSSEIIFS